MGGAMKRHRQLQHMLEIAGEHRLATAMGEPVGMKRDGNAARDGEQAETDPGDDQPDQARPGTRRALRARQRIDGVRSSTSLVCSFHVHVSARPINVPAPAQ